jgi:CRP-like cAMP-binding protein
MCSLALGAISASEPLAQRETPVDIRDMPRSSFRRQSTLSGINVANLDIEQLEVDRQQSKHTCVVHPFSTVRHYWDLAQLAFLAYTAIVLPLQFAFDVISLGLLVLDQTTNLIFMVDVLLNFRTGFLDVKERTIVLEPRRIAINYLRSWFLVDLFAATPFDLIALSCGTVCAADPTLHWGLKWLRVLRMLRMLSLSRILSRLHVLSGLKHTSSMAMYFCTVGLFVAHVAACSWYALGTHGGTWVLAKDPNGTWTDLDAYVAALYWACTTMSTIGYGDIVAGNTPERLFSCVVMTFGSCIYAYGITSVIASLAGVHEHERQLMARKDQLNRYCAKMSVPSELAQKLREYFVHYQNAYDTFNERNLLRMLSPGLRASLSSLANAPLLRRVTFFEHSNEACVNEMAQLLVPNLFVPDEVIITKGSVGEEMYVIKNGSVAAYIEFGDARQELAVLRVGQFFGEGALLRGKSALRSASVRALTYSLVYSLHVDAMSSILPRYPDVHASIANIERERRQSNATMSVRTFGHLGCAAMPTEASSQGPRPPTKEYTTAQQQSSDCLLDA